MVEEHENFSTCATETLLWCQQVMDVCGRSICKVEDVKMLRIS